MININDISGTHPIEEITVRNASGYVESSYSSLNGINSKNIDISHLVTGNYWIYISDGVRWEIQQFQKL